MKKFLLKKLQVIFTSPFKLHICNDVLVVLTVLPLCKPEHRGWKELWLSAWNGAERLHRTQAVPLEEVELPCVQVSSWRSQWPPAQLTAATTRVFFDKMCLCNSVKSKHQKPWQKVCALQCQGSISCGWANTEETAIAVLAVNDSTVQLRIHSANWDPIFTLTKKRKKYKMCVSVCIFFFQNSWIPLSCRNLFI